jgi:hypothetical protein
MNIKDEKKPLEIGSAAGPLQRLIRTQRVYEALNERIQPLLPESARGRIQVACVDDSILVLACASSAWASKARMESARILEAARALWPKDLQKIKVIVSPGVSRADSEG